MPIRKACQTIEAFADRPDFDGNGFIDCAVLLLRHGTARCALLRQQPDDQWVVDELSGPWKVEEPWQEYLAPVKPGTVTYWEEPYTDEQGVFHDGGKTGKLELRHDGFELGFYGKAGVLHYWTGERFATVITPARTLPSD